MPDLALYFGFILIPFFTAYFVRKALRLFARLAGWRNNTRFLSSQSLKPNRPKGGTAHF